MFRRFIQSSISHQYNQNHRFLAASFSRSYGIVTGSRSAGGPDFGGSQPGSSSARTVSGNLSDPRPSSYNPVGANPTKAAFPEDYAFRGKDVSTGTVSREEIEARKEHELIPESSRFGNKDISPENIPEFDDSKIVSVWVGPEIRSRRSEPDDEEPQLYLRNVPKYKKAPLGTDLERLKDGSMRTKPARRPPKRE
mmetsp:Transcript_6722/g.25188  ORF Transcript_6722/g.25188 Transcript_6722/m.25188 type:complete len:195 (-) Transcript_6722:965-1549(-)|eukprot:CAMPEP_0117446526 /NCGR_PEP_ID=MMETSP0759-20121206/6388_1 /TAXON_ID=63605 /ORGANISM="Percolomonas cosmopolitus, Strain WS" /LENGTH=194 /DNA_ID=CAMNT_0005238799 /DNA_START=18 /DNA_END=602 /DNA_ORIENTATION=-